MAAMAGTRRPRRAWPLLALALVAVLALAGGTVIGVWWQSGRVDRWHTGQGYVGADQVSVRYRDWTYGGAIDGVPWIGADGAWHDGGWPTCPRRFETQSVRFQERSVTVSGATWRPIVAIDCRP